MPDSRQEPQQIEDTEQAEIVSDEGFDDDQDLEEPTPEVRPFRRTAHSLTFAGILLVPLETFAITSIGSQTQPIDPNVISLMAIAPLVLIASGIVIYFAGPLLRRVIERTRITDHAE